MKKPIEIWAPKYSTNSALIGEHHITKGLNLIIFTKANHLKGKMFSINDDEIRTYERKPNGKGWVYEVPMDKLAPL